MRKFALLLTFFIGGVTVAQTSLNMSLIGTASYINDNNDIWGYTDSVGTEYALVGTIAGVSLVDISGTNPVKKQFIQGPYSIWRDLKTWEHYTYVTHDSPLAWNTIPSHGLLIIDMDSVNNANPRFKTMNPVIPLPGGGFDTLKTAHNLYIDENGFCYLFGANISNGGALIFDLNQDPWNPVYVGMFDDYYLHDGMVRGDTLWGSAVYQGVFNVVDVAQKDSTVVLASKTTPTIFTHNTWISDDNATLFTTDEKPGAFVTAYDVRDLSNITETDRIQSSLGTNVIPHNAHVYKQWVVTSYYTSGVQIVDAKFPELLVEVGYYDTSPSFNSSGFNGNWGAYPYFDSEKIICTDIEEGLYVLEPEYVAASRVHVYAYDSITKAPLSNVNVVFNSANVSDITSIDGLLDLGTHLGINDSYTMSLSGYVTSTGGYNWQQGAFDTLNVALLNVNNINVTEWSERVLAVYPNPSQGSFQITGIDQGLYELRDLSGRVLEQGVIEQNQLQLNGLYAQGQYVLRVIDKDFSKQFPVVLLP